MFGMRSRRSERAEVGFDRLPHGIEPTTSSITRQFQGTAGLMDPHQSVMRISMDSLESAESAFSSLLHGRRSRRCACGAPEKATFAVHRSGD
jgi:hypothetical protein